MSEQCRSCQASVMWLQHESTGKRAPIDLVPVLDGNILVDEAAGTYRVIAGAKRRLVALDPDRPLHTNHFATCPQARSWKGGKKAVQP